MYNVRDVRQIEIHMTEPLVLDSPCEVEIPIVKLKSINHQVVLKFWQN
jgi:hypothetical protein